MSDQPTEPAGSDPTTMPDPHEGPNPLDPDMPTGPGDVGSGDIDSDIDGDDGDGDGPGTTPAGAADTASIGTPDESASTAG